MLADRGIDAARLAEAFRPRDLAMQRLAHTVEALELVRRISGERHDRRDGMGVMRGKLWIEQTRARKQRPRRGEIRDVSVHLAREHWI